MPIKRPKRTKKPYKGRALVFARQYSHRARKTALYQEQAFYMHGPEIGLINAIQALSLTVAKFNEQYQDTLTDRHGLIILAIKHYCTLFKVQLFHADDIRAYYNLDSILGMYVAKRRLFQSIIADVARLDFCNPHGHRWAPTTRIKVFAAEYDKILKSLFETAKE